MQVRVRWLSGTGPYPWIGLVLLVVATLSLVGTMYGSSWLLWTGQPVHASEQGGIVYYTYRGVTYSFDDTGSQQVPGGTPTRTRTVYLNPSDPSQAVLDSAVSRGIDLVTIIGPLLGAIVFVALGFRRRHRNNRRQRLAGALPPEQRFGEGLDHDLVQRLLAQQKADGWQAVRKRPPSTGPTGSSQVP